MDQPLVFIAMGVSGCGKSTFAKALAARLSARFIEGDDWHSPDNKAKMAAGNPLTDADRAPWLAALAQEVAAHRSTRRPLVLACSALKRAYRAILGHSPDILYVHLICDPAALAQRLAQRQGHFMPATLLDSQIQALEPPLPEENVLTLSANSSTCQQIDTLLMATQAEKLQ